jgi:hypothetical protein
VIGAGSLLLGLLVLGVELGCAFAASALVIRRRGSSSGASISTLCHGVLITGFLLIVHVVPGVFGVLDRWTVMAASVLVLVLVMASTERTASTDPGALTAGPTTADRAAAFAGRAGESLIGWAVALAAVALVVGYTGGFLRTEFGTVPVGIDALTFHLPDVASWMRSGSLWQIDQFVPGQAHGNYPNNGDVLFLLLVLPFKSTLLVRAAMLPYLALTGIAVFAIGRELGASRPFAVTYGAALCAIPSIAWPTLIDTGTDTVMLFGFATGIQLLLRHARTGFRFELLVAGLALGISFGTKWYAVPDVVVVLVVWAVSSLLTGERVARVARRGLWLLGLTLSLGGFWLLRNLVESGDPFFPAKIAPLGVTLFDAPPDLVQQLGGFTVGDYLLEPHVLGTYIVPALRDALQLIGLLIAGSALVAAAVAAWELRPGTRRPPAAAQAPVVALAVTAVLLAIVYVFTPDTALGPLNLPVQAEANVRYLMPALIAGAPLAAWLCTRLGTLGLVVQLAAVVLAVKALTRVYPDHQGFAVALAAIAFVVGVAWWALRQRSPTPRVSGWLRPAAIYALLLLALVAGAFPARSRFTYRTYAAADQTLSWLLAHAPSGHAVGLANVWSNAGFSPILPAFGPRLGNRVGYVGPFVRHLLGQYPTEASFDEGLKRGRYDLLVIGLGFPDPQPRVPDETWAQAAGYRAVARSPRLALYERASSSSR